VKHALSTNNAFEHLASLNPVPHASRGDLAEDVDHLRPELTEVRRATSRRRRPRGQVVAFAAVAMSLALLGGVALAADWTPLTSIGAADHASTPSDVLPADVKDEVGKHELSPAGAVGARLVDKSRLVGALADGSKVYIVPTSKEKICLVVGSGSESCFAPLSRTNPITVSTSKDGPGAPHFVWGVATDGVESVSFAIGGELVTVPVASNFYAWEGHRTDSMQAISNVSAKFTDGTTWTAP
jgi:hypothetical protein